MLLFIFFRLEKIILFNFVLLSDEKIAGLYCYDSCCCFCFSAASAAVIVGVGVAGVFVIKEKERSYSPGIKEERELKMQLLNLAKIFCLRYANQN